MSDYRRWFRFGLKALFLLMLLVATFMAGYSLASRQWAAEWRQVVGQRDEALRRVEKAEADLAQAETDRVRAEMSARSAARIAAAMARAANRQPAQDAVE